MGLISDGMPLGDYLESKLGSFRVSNRMPALASKGQKGIVTLNGGPSPIRIYVWNALEIIRDPFTGAGAGKVTLTATALVSEVYIPHTTSQGEGNPPEIGCVGPCWKPIEGRTARVFALQSNSVNPKAGRCCTAC